MKIVLALDFSPLSEIVVSEVTARPWPQGTVLQVLHVLDLFTLTESVEYAEPFINKEREGARALAGSVAERLRSSGLEVGTQIIEGYPATAIVGYARQWGADFVIVGSHGHSGIARFFLGSVAQSVARNAHCSVEVVRASDRDKSGVGGAGMRILLATDGSDFSAASARSIAARPWPQGSEVKVVSVVDLVVPVIDPWYGAGEIIGQLREENTKRAQDAVRAAEKIVGGAGLKVTGEVLMGGPKWRVRDEAKEWGANLIVVGSHGKRGITRLFLGSVSEAVAMRAHCSVDVIRESTLLNRD
jgi:nucleotide-binding universal stress UspA family protein